MAAARMTGILSPSWLTVCVDDPASSSASRLPSSLTLVTRRGTSRSESAASER